MATPPSPGLKCCRSDGRFAFHVIQNTDRRQSRRLSSQSVDETAHPARGDFACRPHGSSACVGGSTLHSRLDRRLRPRLPHVHEQHGFRLPHERHHGRRQLPSELLFAIPPPGFRTFYSNEGTSSFGNRFAGRARVCAPRSPDSPHRRVAYRRASIVSPDLSPQSGVPNLILL